MSTVVNPQTPPPALEKEDPWRYGWRYVQRESPDGVVGYERVPLRQEDLLHPREDDFIVTNDAHNRDCTYLKNVLEAWASGKQGMLVLADVRVDWQRAGIEPHGPDLAVFEGVREWEPTDGTFTVADHGAQPVLVIEVTSPSTRNIDLGDKVAEYARAGVPFYAIIDRHEGPQGADDRLLGYRAIPEGQLRLPLDERGRLWLAPVGLWLAVEDRKAALYDEWGNRLGEYPKVVEERKIAEARAAAEAEARRLYENRALEAEIRVKELEAELQRLRGQNNGGPANPPAP
jgi:colicin import membrane protein